jgi:malonyl-CoA O-methyltransferase
VAALERRVIRERLGPLSGRCFVDVATGTGYWLNYARSRGARAYGVDVSAEMLSKAASKPGLKGRLIRADMNVLPLKDAVADIAVCSLALGYVRSVGNLFRELARVSRRVIVSDLHERAIEAGWRRCFEVEGARYQIEHFEHTAGELDEAAKGSGFRIDWRVTSHIGEPEREIFVVSGREHAFAEASRVPAILSTCWTRP